MPQKIEDLKEKIKGVNDTLGRGNLSMRDENQAIEYAIELDTELRKWETLEQFVKEVIQDVLKNRLTDMDESIQEVANA